MPLKVMFPPCVSKPVPVVIAPLFVVCNDSVLLPMSHVEAAAPVILSAPAEVRLSVPEVVVDRLNGPLATVTVSPPVLGPVSVRAVVPENVTFPPCVSVPVPVVIAPLLAVCSDSVLAPTSHVDAAPPVRDNAPADVTLSVPEVVVLSASGPVATVRVSPPVAGPVMVRAVVPLKVSPAPSVVSPPLTVNAFVPVMVVSPFNETAPDVVPNVPDPLKLMFGFVVPFPTTTEVALVPPMLIAAAPPVSRPSALAPLLLTVSTPAADGWIVAPRVTPLTAPDVIVPLPMFTLPADSCTKFVLSKPSSISELKACGAAVSRTRGVISASLPTFMPKYRALVLKSTLPGSVVPVPRFTWNKPLLTATVAWVSSHLQLLATQVLAASAVGSLYMRNRML